MAFHLNDSMGEKERGFFLATMLFDNVNSDSHFGFLAKNDQKKFESEATRILSLSRKERVNLLLSELRILLLKKHESSWHLVDPSWVIKILEKESRTIQLIALASLPKTYAHVLNKKFLFSSEELANCLDYPAELLKCIRNLIASRLAAMQLAVFSNTCVPYSLLMLTKSELEIVFTDSVWDDSESISSFEVFGSLMKALDSQDRLQVAQRLHYDIGTRLLSLTADGSFRPVDTSKSLAMFCENLVRLGREGKIDRKFRRCILK